MLLVHFILPHFTSLYFSPYCVSNIECNITVIKSYREFNLKLTIQLGNIFLILYLYVIFFTLKNHFFFFGVHLLSPQES